VAADRQNMNNVNAAKQWILKPVGDDAQSEHDGETGII
jgi:hypothetical protein